MVLFTFSVKLTDGLIIFEIFGWLYVKWIVD